MRKKYLCQCRYCGRILFKTREPIVYWLIEQIKCPNCKKILKPPEGFFLALDKTSGLDKIK